MILYHATDHSFIDSILRYGLRPSGIGIVYLSPKPLTSFGNTILKVETQDLRLTAFDDCTEWEVLCWGHIPPEDIQIFRCRIA